MYWCYNCPLSVYRQEHLDRLKVDASYFADEINMYGHQGHFYETIVVNPASNPVIVQLLGVDLGSRMIKLNVFKPEGGIALKSIHEDDLYSVTYLGATLPSFPTPRPPWCTMYPWGPGC